MKKVYCAFFIILFCIPFYLIAQHSENVILSLNINSREDACNSSTGSAYAYANGGVQPYSYLWSTGGTTYSITGLAAGNYTCLVTDNAGDTISGGETVINGFLIAQAQVDQVDIQGACGFPSNGCGEISLQFYNGVPPYSANWCDGGTGTTRTGLYGYWNTVTGCPNVTYNGPVYQYDVTDANGCPTDSIYSTEIVLQTIGYWPQCGWFFCNEVYGSCNGNNGIISLNISENDQSFQFKDPDEVKVLLRDSITNTAIDSFSFNPPWTPTSYNVQFSNLAPATYKAEYYFETAGTWYQISSYFIFESEYYNVPDLSPLCGSVNGKVFMDINKNCNKDFNDINISNAIIHIEPGNIYLMTDTSGNYSMGLNYGSYTIEHSTIYTELRPKCPSLNPDTFTLAQLNSVQTISFADTSNGIADIASMMSSTQPRVGFQNGVSLTCRNASINKAFQNIVTLNYDTVLQYLNATPLPSVITNGNIQWNIDSLNGFEERNFSVNFQVPADTSLIGYDWKAMVQASTISPENYLANNTDSVSRIISAAVDPNAKYIDPHGFGNNNYIPDSFEELKYTIQFQNTGTDTAFNIVITDTISPLLDLMTINPGASSHAFWYEAITPGIIKFHFDNILLPDSNANEPGSHGFVAYKIRLKQPAAAGMVITNEAFIEFDFNPAVATNIISNELYDCSAFDSMVSQDTMMCRNDSVMFTHQPLLPDGVEWYIDQVYFSGSDTIYISGLSAGNHQVDMNAVTPYCTLAGSKTIYVDSDPDPVINVNNNLLSSTLALSYQWFINGLLIIGANWQNYTAVTSGWYVVNTINSNGCSYYSDSVYVLISGEAEVENEPLSVFIAIDGGSKKLQVKVTGIFQNYNLTLTDAMGRKIIADDEIKTSSYLSDLKKINRGIYFVTIEFPHKKICRKVIII